MVIFKSVRVVYLSEMIKHKGFFKKEDWLRYEKDNSIKQGSLGLLTLFYFNNELYYPRVYLYQSSIVYYYYIVNISNEHLHLTRYGLKQMDNILFLKKMLK